MRSPDPISLRHGPLTVFLAPLAGCPDLLPLLRTSASTHVWRGHPLEALRRVLRRYRMSSSSRLGAAGRAVGLTGFLSYECNRWIERLPSPREDVGPSLPEMAWVGMRVMILLDHLEQRGWLLSIVDPHAPEPLARREACELLERAAAQLALTSGPDDVARSPRPALDACRSGPGHQFAGDDDVLGVRADGRARPRAYPRRRHLPGERGSALHCGLDAAGAAALRNAAPGQPVALRLFCVRGGVPGRQLFPGAAGARAGGAGGHPPHRGHAAARGHARGRRGEQPISS